MNTFRLKRNLDEAVYEQILSSIFEGKFHSGEQVQIERLCEQYEITRKYLFVPLFANGFDTPSTRIFGCCCRSFPNHCISLTVPCNLTFSI